MTKTKQKRADKCPEGGEQLPSNNIRSLFGISDSGLPELQQPVLTVGADEVLVGVVGDADHVLLMDLERRR